MQLTRAFTIFLVISVLGACTPLANQPQTATASAALPYPEAARGERTDDYFGETVADPYRWMEDLDSKEVAEFVAAENAISMPYLAAIPARDRVAKRIDALWSYERYRLPVSEGGRYFYRRNDGTQDQDVLYVSDDLSMEARVLIDPNTFSQDATIALSSLSVSPNGALIAYSTSDGGSDWKTWHVRNVGTGEDTADVIRGTKFTGVSWHRDSSGFYYSRYPWVANGADGEADDGQQVKIYHHRVGDPQSADKMIYAITDHDTRSPSVQLTEDGRYLIISAFDGYQTNGLYYRDMRDPGAKVVRLFDDWDGLYYYLGNNGSRFYLYTTQGRSQRKGRKHRCGQSTRWSRRDRPGTSRGAGSSQLHRRLCCDLIHQRCLLERPRVRA